MLRARINLRQSGSMEPTTTSVSKMSLGPLRHGVLHDSLVTWARFHFTGNACKTQRCGRSGVLVSLIAVREGTAVDALFSKVAIHHRKANTGGSFKGISVQSYDSPGGAVLLFWLVFFFFFFLSGVSSVPSTWML